VSVIPLLVGGGLSLLGLVMMVIASREMKACVRALDKAEEAQAAAWQLLQEVLRLQAATDEALGGPGGGLDTLREVRER